MINSPYFTRSHENAYKQYAKYKQSRAIDTQKSTLACK